MTIGPKTRASFFALLLSASATGGAPGCATDGKDGADGQSCTIQTDDDARVLVCPDGTSAVLGGASATAGDGDGDGDGSGDGDASGDGDVTGDGDGDGDGDGSTGGAGPNGQNGYSCSVDDDDGSYLLACDDGASMIIDVGSFGQGGDAGVSSADGTAYVDLVSGDQDVPVVTITPEVNGRCFVVASGSVDGPFGADGDSHLDVSKDGEPSSDEGLVFRDGQDGTAATAAHSWDVEGGTEYTFGCAVGASGVFVGEELACRTTVRCR